MHDIVLITTYNRPDYLRVCLEYLAAAQGIQDHEVWVCIDRGKSLIREFYDVLNDFRNQISFSVFLRPEHTYIGNTFNTLEAYKEAYQTDAKFIYLVEDDVLVRPDFFKWHQAVQSRGDFFCSVAYRCSRNAEARRDITDASAYFTTARDYASIGVCWRRENLAHVIQHAKDEYYRDLKGYLVRRFPNNRFSDCYAEQDGLIMRTMGETHGLYTVWPYVPRAYHVGFAGYNRPRGTRLSYREIKQTIHDEEKIRAADKDFGDIEPVPTSLPPDWLSSDLHCVQEFN
jgi:hypothetical protein